MPVLVLNRNYKIIKTGIIGKLEMVIKDTIYLRVGEKLEIVSMNEIELVPKVDKDK
jgi:hypothetical protein